MFKILLAVDGSDNSFKAVNKTIKLAKSMDADVTALSVVQDIPFYHEGMATEHLVLVQQNFQERAENAAKEVLEKVKDLFNKQGLEVNTVFKSGHPAELICQIAEEGRFDFIVMGSRGLGGVKELLLGSVSNRVAHCAKNSVLIVK
ncbi:MAG: universal stress protein [Firmicutes bacterium]|nr:universal stress protein [Bacillota bacterium]